MVPEAILEKLEPMMLNKKIRSACLVYTRPGLRKFFAASSTTMESLP